jgi:hypothetical protein
MEKPEVPSNARELVEKIKSIVSKAIAKDDISEHDIDEAAALILAHDAKIGETAKHVCEWSIAMYECADVERLAWKARAEKAEAQLTAERERVKSLSELVEINYSGRIKAEAAVKALRKALFEIASKGVEHWDAEGKPLSAAAIARAALDAGKE